MSGRGPFGGGAKRTAWGRTTDDKQLEVVDLLISPTRLERPLAVGPGVPAEHVAILRQAFQQTTKDPAFLADAKKMKLELAPVPGEEIQEISRQLFATPKDVIAEAKSMNQ
jgi:tripartite-type tricarboxylate transporter receptor subunit TctC